jgi:tRNA threonylcarbamoyladenosine biosynthesis protein TsaB
VALLLLIETATDTCSVSLASDGKIIACEETHNSRSHASILTVYIDKILRENKISPQQLDGISVSKGPGSYTGLRIGVATAKGLCFALEKPLISIPTLQSMAFLAKEQFNFLLCPMIDAKRLEVYTALFNQELNYLEETKAVILDEHFLENYLAKDKIVFFGNGAEKLKPLLQNNTSAIFYDAFLISSKGMIALAEEKFNKKEFEDVAYFEPFYLKDFVPTVSKKITFINKF